MALEHCPAHLLIPSPFLCWSPPPFFLWGSTFHGSSSRLPFPLFYVLTFPGPFSRPSPLQLGRSHFFPPFRWLPLSLFVRVCGAHSGLPPVLSFFFFPLPMAGPNVFLLSVLMKMFPCRSDDFCPGFSPFGQRPHFPSRPLLDEVFSPA